ncbi:MAG: PilC/PilY family type IV pilus protein, partial [Wenzhouxiangellaceae bacterium]|nr:PilC/PilY family type IV pilus protein [Wenzhouxiangellaceae bacterium]
MKRFNPALISFVATLGLLAGGPARASDVDLAQSPLFLLAPVKPSMIMALDDSGSMDSEVIFDSNDGALWWNTNRQSFTGLGVSSDGSTDVEEPGRVNFNAQGGANNTWKKYVYLFPNGADGSNGFRRNYADDTHAHFAIPPLPQFAYARSPADNFIYFDPSQDYPAFPSSGSVSFGDVNPTAAPVDKGRNSNDPFDLTQNVERTDINWVFKFHAGMELPAGTRVKHAQGGDVCPLVDPVLGSNIDYSEWTDLSNGAQIALGEQECEIAISYFPATFWLPGTAALPTDFGWSGVPLVGGRGPDGTAYVGYEIKPENFTTSAAYQEAIQKFANWFSYYRKRSLLTRAAIGQSFTEVNFLRNGYFRINNRATVTMSDMEVAADRRAFFDWLYTLRGIGGTPNKQAVDHIGIQFERTDAGAPVALSCQKNFGMLVTDGFSNQWTGAGVGNADGPGSPLDGTFLSDSQSETMADIAYSYYVDNIRPDLATGEVPVPTSCDQANPPLDLDCNANPHMNLFGVTLGAKGLVFGRDEAATEDPYTNNPTWPTTFPARHPNAVDDLWHGTLNTRGEMFSATRPSELVDALSAVLESIASRIQPVGVSSTSTRLDQDSVFYEAELDSTRWSGDLRARRADDGSQVWQASNVMPAPIARSIYTANANGNGVVFDTSLPGTVRTRIFGTDLSVAEQNAVINYLRGDRGNEPQNGGTFRERDGIIGDVANSRPRYSGRRNEGWARLPSNQGGGASYNDYVDTTKANRSPTVLVGANGGLLHAFDAESGIEKFAYLPAGVHSTVAQLADPGYSHRFYVDGQVRVADAYIGGGWKTVAVGGLGGGGRGVYALDISSPGSFSSGDVLWELLPEDHPELGHVFGQPVVTRLGNGTWVAIFGNGYNSDAHQPHLFIVRLADGQVLQKLPIGSSAGNGLSSVAALLDPVTRLFVRRIYGGDLNGKMWRIDFSDSGTASVAFSGSPLITVPNNRPIASGPSLAANPGGGLMVYFGTGKLIETEDRVGTPTEFDVFYAVRDTNSAFNSANSLEPATITESGGNRVLTGADVTGDSNGWFVELGTGEATGERVLARPEVVFGSLVFTTFEPDNEACTAGGQR